MTIWPSGGRQDYINDSRQILLALYATREKGLCHKEMCVSETQIAKSWHVVTKTPQMNIWPPNFELVSLDWRVVVNIFLLSLIILHVLPRCIPQPPNQEKHLQTKFLRTMHWDLVSQQNSIMIRVVNLKTNCSNNWKSTVELLDHELLPTIPKGTGRLNWNWTLLQMLKMLTGRQKTNRKDSLNKLIYAYKYTWSEVTGFSPFHLLFGRSPRLPVELLFNLSPGQEDCNHLN